MKNTIPAVQYIHMDRYILFLRKARRAVMYGTSQHWTNFAGLTKDIIMFFVYIFSAQYCMYL